MIYPGYGLLGVLVLILDVIAIVSVISGRSSVERKVLWTFLVLILPIVGMVLYYLVGKSSQDKIAV